MDLNNIQDHRIFQAVRMVQRRNAWRDQIRLLALATFALPVGLWGHGPLCGALTAICLGTIARAILLESRL